ncbi:MAG: hypothetical protein D3923_09990 [Candidatus Electrothrix sp. AR3]|nr:hypothetical protein [Candidatus Electrothrix sp. AR3]
MFCKEIFCPWLEILKKKIKYFLPKCLQSTGCFLSNKRAEEILCLHPDFGQVIFVNVTVL